jgi:hypothetical protein
MVSGPPPRVYQDAFRTPGIRPFRDMDRKQHRQSMNFRMKARGRPQIWHRFLRRELNLGVFETLIFWHRLAIRYLLKGIPNILNSSRDSSSELLRTTKVMFMPWTNSTSSILISGNTICSVSPML